MQNSVKNIVFLALSLVIICSTNLAFAGGETKGESKATSKTQSSSAVSKVLTSYRASKGFSAQIKKVVTQEALGTIVKSEGEFFYSKGKLRMNITKPEHSILVYDGKYVWFETPLDEKRMHVTRMRANKLTKSDSLLTAVFDSKQLLKTFNFKSMKKSGDVSIYSFLPKNKKSDVLSVDIGIKENSLSSISYTDRVENRVTLEFDSIKKTNVPVSKFSYKPPKSAEVTEM